MLPATTPKIYEIKKRLRPIWHSLFLYYICKIYLLIRIPYDFGITLYGVTSRVGKSLVLYAMVRSAPAVLVSLTSNRWLLRLVAARPLKL